VGLKKYGNPGQERAAQQARILATTYDLVARSAGSLRAALGLKTYRKKLPS
jgi:hypothetical protein